MIETTYFILFVLMINILIGAYNKFTKSKTTVAYCGIVGYSGKKPCNIDKVSLMLMHNSDRRGGDNTGIYSLETGVIKNDKKADEFLIENPIPKTNLLIAHARKSSVGGKATVNAHPFENDNIVLVHNGTLTNYITLRTAAKLDVAKFSTDTQILAKLMDDDSKKEQVVFSTLSEYTGAAALLFTDKRDPTVLFAYRNMERPLFHGVVDKGMYISSMKENLQIIGCEDIQEFPAFYVHTIKEGKLLNSTYYKEKEAVVTSHVSNVRYKDRIDESTDDYIDTLKVTNQIATNYLVDRWGQALASQNDPYCNAPMRIKAGNWYFMEDSSTNNSYDLQFVDEDNNVAWGNKFMFDFKHMEYSNNYGYAVKNIFSVETPSLCLWTKGSVIPIVKGSLISKENTIPCVYKDEQVIEVEIDCIRPAVKSEIEEFTKKVVEDINKIITNPSTSEKPKLDFEQVRAAINNQNAINQLKAIGPVKDAEIVVDAETQCPFIEPSLDTLLGSEDKREPIEETIEEVTAEVIEVEEKPEIEIMPEDSTEGALMVTFVLDTLSAAFDDVQELTNSIKWDELTVKVAALGEVIDESYNTKMVRDFALMDPRR